MNTNSNNQHHRRIINHKVLRQGTGIIALLLPVLVDFLSDHSDRLSSVSISYWTDSGDIFVGSLVAVGFFLAAYNGTGYCNRDAEYVLSKIAGVSALIVAFVPTGCFKAPCDVPSWVESITFGHNVIVHNTAAIILFICLYLLINYFARRAKSKGKDFRSDLYWLISLGMLVGMPVTYFIGLQVDWYYPIYGVEVVGLVLFGIGWIIAGTYKSEQPIQVPDGTDYDEIEVQARNKNNPTGIILSAGEVYIFKSEGCWKDAFIWCGPTGWGPHWKWWTKKNRVKDQAIFTVCGNIGGDDKFGFGIGKELEWTVPDSINQLPPEKRKLYVFANDWENKYENNKGSLMVTIYKKKEN